MNKKIVLFLLVLLSVCTLLSNTIIVNAAINVEPGKDKFEAVFDGADGGGKTEEDLPPDVITPEKVVSGKCVLCNKQHDLTKLDGLGRAAYDMACVVYGGTKIEPDSGLGKAIRFNVATHYKSLWRTIGIYNDLTIPLAYVFIFLYALSDMTEKAINDMLNAELFFKYWLKVVIALIIVNNSMMIIEALINFSLGMFEYVKSPTEINLAKAGNCVYDSVLGGDFFEPFALIGSLLGSYIPTLCATVTMYLAVWGRNLEICIRAVFAPVALSDISKGTKSTGFRYLKQILSLAIQGAILQSAMYAYSVISGTIGVGLIPNIISVMTLVTLFFKAKEIGDDLVGV